MDIEKELDQTVIVRADAKDTSARLCIAIDRIEEGFDPYTGAENIDPPTVLIAGVEFYIDELLDRWELSQWYEKRLVEALYQKRLSDCAHILAHEYQKSQMKPGDDREPF